jgi:hypothetical protein
LKKVIQRGWPEEKKILPQELQYYFPFREELTLQNGLIFKSDRLVIPVTLKGSIMERLHTSHIGIQGFLRRVREAIYWPNMNREIENYSTKCETCRKEPLISHDVSNRQWEKIGIDLCDFDNKAYLVTVDYYSFFKIKKSW